MQKEVKKKSTPLFGLKTYRTLTALLENLSDKQDQLNVFSTDNVARLVKEKYSLTACGLDDFGTKLFSGYRTGITQIYLQSQIRNQIHQDKYKQKAYLLNRIPTIINTVYALADLGVSNLSFSNESDRKTEIIQLMSALMKDPVIQTYHSQKEMLTKQQISTILCGHDGLNKISFYEIEYLNYGRMNLIHWLCSKGFEIEFYIPYNKELPSLYEFWQMTYEVATQQDIAELIEHEGIQNNNGARFAQFNEGENTVVNDRKDVEIIEFQSPRDFAFYFQSTTDKIAAINPDDVNRIVDNTISKLYENDYGKFVYYLQFCKVTDETIRVNYDNLLELVTSAWISTRIVKGKDALALLKDLESYMNGVETIADVKERLVQLSQLDMISKTFDNENAAEAGRNRMKRYMLNPFRTFAFLQQGRYKVTINQLIELIEQTEKICLRLLLHESKVEFVTNYFNNWETVLEQYKDKWDSEAYDFWKSVFVQKYPDDWEFAIQELLSLIYLTAANRDENQPINIHSMPTLPFNIMARNSNQAIHITNLTLMNFPENHHTMITAFFSYSEMKEIVTQSVADNQLVKSLLHALLVDFSVSENFNKLGNYQIYNILSNYKGPVKFSWIKHLQENDFRNVYLDILADLYQDGVVNTYRIKEKLEVNSPENKQDRFSYPNSIDKLKGKVPNLFWLDHDFCSKKFFLTALIDQQPVYESEFHQQFVFSKIGRLFSMSQAERNEFQTLIYPLFPQWTFSKKENLIDTEYLVKLGVYKDYENISYPKEINRLHILRSVYRLNRRTKARNQYRKYTAFNEAEVLKQFKDNVGQYEVKAEPGNHCKMCPHIQSCSEGVYAIDNRS